MIISRTQPLSKRLTELPTCHYGEVDQSALVKTMEIGFGFGKTYSTFYFIFYRNPTLYQWLLYEHWKTHVTKWLTWRLMMTSNRSWRWMMTKSLTQNCCIVQQKGAQHCGNNHFTVKKESSCPATISLWLMEGQSSWTLVLPSHTVETGGGRPEITHHIHQAPPIWGGGFLI